MARLYMMLLMALTGIFAMADEKLKGMIPLDITPETINYAQWHVRACPDAAGKCRWSLIWNMEDTLNCKYAEVLTTNRVPGDEVYSHHAEIAVYSVQNGAQQLLWDEQLQIDDDCISLKLIYDGFSARLYAGDDEQQLIGEVPFNPAISHAAIMAHTPIKILRKSCLSIGNAALNYSQWDSEEQLRDYLTKSEDPLEGVWKYLDRNIDSKKASLGGKYTVATAKNAGGTYDIIYLGGADRNAASWKPLMVKGWITPTIFNGNYDAIWTDAYGYRLEDDTYATLSADGAILTIYFPIQRSQMRFSREVAE